MSEQDNAPSWLPKILVLLGVIVGGATVAYFQGKQTAAVPADNAAPTPDLAAADEKAPTAAESYKDGVYTTTGNYSSPAGAETIDVTVTVADGVVTDASVVANATNPASKMWQGKFIDGYKELVVGKELSGLSLGVVSGASLTPKGFNDALEDIRTQAGV